MKKLIKNNIHLVIAMFIYISLLMISVYSFMDQYKWDGSYVSAYSFWRFMTNFGIADYIGVSMIIILGIGCVYTIHKEFTSGFFMDRCLRQSYNEYTLKQILKCYKKALIFGPLMNLIFILIGFLLFDNNLNTGDMYSHISNFFIHGMNYPLFYIFLAIIASYLGMLFMCNIVLIFSRFIKKFPLVLIASFMTLNFICLCCEIIGKNFLYELFKSDLFSWFSPYRLLHPLMNDYMYINIIFGIILFLISFLILLIIYFGRKNIEKMVLNNG